ncbi:MAG TPA: lipid-binding SYLF domain-containing protein [Candidatus Acidoferrales bacterium]|nr:lipid-binding SYLF domain-containing protein [Candidatus Acidoferrales bacterium]
MRKLVTLSVFCASFAWAALASGSPQNTNAKSEELQKAGQALQEMTSSDRIPHGLLNTAQCIAVIPNMTKAGFIAGGKHGDGVVSCRDSSGWSAPAFISLSGGSFGLQAGAEEAKIILLLNEQGKDELLNGNFKLGAEVVAAGPTGNGYDASTAWKKPILAYSESKGVYGGLNIEGTDLKIDHGAMKEVYGSDVAPRTVLSGSTQKPPQAQPFISALPAK